MRPIQSTEWFNKWWIPWRLPEDHYFYYWSRVDLIMIRSLSFLTRVLIEKRSTPNPSSEFRALSRPNRPHCHLFELDSWSTFRHDHVLHDFDPWNTWRCCAGQHHVSRNKMPDVKMGEKKNRFLVFCVNLNLCSGCWF